MASGKKNENRRGGQIVAQTAILFALASVAFGQEGKVKVVGSAAGIPLARAAPAGQPAAGQAVVQPPPAANPAAPTLVMRYDRAVAEAAADLAALSAIDPLAAARVRYVMLSVPSEADTAAIRYTANQVLNFAGEPYPPIPVNAEGTLYRLDLGLYADGDEKKFALHAATWDRQTDTAFYLPTDKFTAVLSPRYRHTDGKVYERANRRITTPAVPADINGQLTALIQATGAAVPIISFDQFMRFALSASDGLYPEFRQIDQSPANGTAEEAFIARAGITQADVARVGGDQRVVLISEVTGNWRIIEYYYSPIVRAGIGPGLVTITRDWKRGRIDPNEHGLENLAKEYAAGRRTHDASEIILFTPAGGVEVAIFDGAGNFLRAAPANVVGDRTVPPPHPPELDGGLISCTRCHGPVNAMFQPAPNYVTALRNLTINGRKWDVFAEGGDAGKPLQRTVSLFKGETRDAFALARITHAKFAIGVSTHKVEDVTAEASRAFDSSVFDYVTPRRAMLKLGYQYATEEAAVDGLNTMIPLTFEPHRISLLRAWRAPVEKTDDLPVKVSADDLQEVLPEMAVRLMAWEASQANTNARSAAVRPPMVENK